MADLLELATDIVIAHASTTEMTSDDLMNEIKAVYATLKGLEQGEAGDVTAKPALTRRQAFKKDEVGCMICGKTGLTTLKRHLATAHEMKPGQYRKRFNIPQDQPLAATNYVEKKRQIALDRGLGNNLAKARAAKKTKAKKAKK
ncbi:MAG TPA: MucR family transcriptional regulator [Syntrophus sp. (in: bacteria)]|jgi:predicted transcriptional regulator|nr:MucR family transcriptional regulator [Syntrophus sp. (in: bacteria)]